jgi:hypothetical protein
MSEIKVGDIATINFKNKSSNTFYVHRLFDKVVQLTHPLFEGVIIEKKINEINSVTSNLKCSTEKQLNFALNNSDTLGFNPKNDLDALCLCFVVTRNLTPKQKGILSNLCGNIASIKLSNDINEAMELVKQNEAILDDFNRMWYNNFNGLFTGKQIITSKKQRSAIFNIAGFVLAELETPVAYK